MELQKHLRFRQVHLDFHTSPEIPGIGQEFDKKLWQERLKTGHVDSITCFACCHHGWCYYPSQVGEMHPGLDFNLLRQQIDACHEIGVRVPIYLTVGVNNRMAELEPGWREVNPAGQWASWVQSPLEPGFKKMCLNSPYLDYICRLIEEAARMFPDADGMFFDIISQGQCCCPSCMRDMKAEGYDPENEEDRKRFSRRTLKKYLQRATAAARCVHHDWPVFHNNGGLLEPGNRDLFPYFSHMELESLPTGGWGYDHFPLLAAYCRNLDHEFLGMTGKFHTSWGEFGGFKHPNALRYECCAMLAQGAKCSIGDQLHPGGMLDESTYRLIGEAYADVERKEPWCSNVTSTATVALLADDIHLQSDPFRKYGEIGISRLLLEEHIPFDRLDSQNDFSQYRVLILPDHLRISADLKKRLDQFLARGGKLVLAGDALLCQEEDKPAFELPLQYEGLSELAPDYVRAAPDFVPGMITTPFVMYRPSRKIKVTGGKSLGEVFSPYFNRAYDHFSSHQHTPYRNEPSGYQAGVLTDQILYFAHPVFKLYALYGEVNLKYFIMKAFRQLAEVNLPLTTSLPSQGRMTLLEQKEEKRYVCHALYASTVLRGMTSPVVDQFKIRATRPIEIIEELNPIYNVRISFRLPRKILRVTLEPQGQEIPFEEKDGVVSVLLPELVCHQMIVLHY